MPRTPEQLEQAAAEAEAWLDELDPRELEKPAARTPDDMRDLGQAVIDHANA